MSPAYNFNAAVESCSTSFVRQNRPETRRKTDMKQLRKRKRKHAFLFSHLTLLAKKS